jgi:hypothetical protein
MAHLHLVLLAGWAAAAVQSTEGNSSSAANPCEACPGGECGNCKRVHVRRVGVVTGYTDGAARFWWFLFFLVIPVALLALCLYSCMSTASRRKSTLQQQQQGVAMGPVPANPAVYGYPIAGQPSAAYVSPVYGAAPQGRQMGATPFLAGGAGLLGGYMLGSALAD